MSEAHRILNVFKEIFASFSTNLPMEKHNCVDYATISNKPIPINLDSSLVDVYNQQIHHGNQFPEHLYPETEYCNNGHRFNIDEYVKLEKTGIIIYTVRYF